MAKSDKKLEFPVFEEVPADEHIDARLQSEHEDAPTVITEVQLEENKRSGEKTETIEKQLESRRTGEADVLTEKLLNNDKKQRNASAYEGDINKLEEKRLAGYKAEEEQYELSASTPKNLRWWEVELGKGQLKIAEKINNLYKLAEDMGRIAETGDSIDSEPDDVLGVEDIEGGPESLIDKKDQSDQFPDFTIEETNNVNDLTFEEIDFQETDVGGTPMLIGKIKFNGEWSDPSEVTMQAKKFIEELHPGLVIDPASIDTNKIGQKELSFAASKDTVAPATLASTGNFDIIFKTAESDEKKKKVMKK